MPLPASSDIVIVGAGAAGLAAAIFAGRARPGGGVVIVDGARTPGAKILVSGGGRCNVTNAVVAETDFWGASSHAVRRILKALPVPETTAFFAELGVPLHEEPDGKLFPDSNRARDVLEALVQGAAQAGTTLVPGARVERIARHGSGFVIDTGLGSIRAAAVVLAAGGQSLPKSGSDGSGYRLAMSLGHSIVAPTPALVPLRLAPDTPHSVHSGLSGVTVDAELALWIDGGLSIRLRGALLWTHFGISGPVVLNASRHWTRGTLLGRDVRLAANWYPGLRFDEVERSWIRAARERPGVTLRRALVPHLPDAMALAILGALALAPDRRAAELTREDRRRLVHALTDWPLPVVETRGYSYAEVTAGGVPLAEIDAATMESRVCPGLYLVGEILDVDGRIGGFNFQWAWCTAAIAGRGATRASTPPSG
jgi:hypothetical protein